LVGLVLRRLRPILRSGGSGDDLVHATAILTEIVVHEPSPVDLQLLFELRVALMQERPLPLAMLRVMRERGWVVLPASDTWVHVRAVLEDATEDTVDAYSYDLGAILVTRAGARELILHLHRFSDADIRACLADEMDEEEVDEAEDEDDLL